MDGQAYFHVQTAFADFLIWILIGLHEVPDFF